MIKKNTTRQISKILIFFVAIGVVSYFYFNAKHEYYNSITSFEECVKSGFFVTSTYPETCVLPGKVFTNPEQKKVAHEEKLVDKETSSNESVVTSFKNLTYFLNGSPLTFSNGKSNVIYNDAKNSTTTIEIMPNEYVFDINDDTIADTALLIRLTLPGSEKNRYYLSSAIGLNTGHVGLNILYIDEGVLRSSSFIYKNGKLELMYELESSTITKKKYYIFKDNLLKEVSP